MAAAVPSSLGLLETNDGSIRAARLKNEVVRCTAGPLRLLHAFCAPFAPPFDPALIPRVTQLVGDTPLHCVVPASYMTSASGHTMQPRGESTASMVSCVGTFDARERTRRGALARCRRGAARDPAPCGALIPSKSYIDSPSRGHATRTYASPHTQVRTTGLMRRHGSGAHVTRSRGTVTFQETQLEQASYATCPLVTGQVSTWRTTRAPCASM